MSAAGGPKIVSDDLVLCLDAHDAKSYPGEPITNLCFVNSGDNQYLAQGYDWDNSGAGTRNRNVTDIRKPKAVNDNVFNERYIRICSCVVATVGSIHFGMGYTTSVSASTQYMVSLYYRQNKAGIGGPYIRGKTSNANHGALKWIGRDGKQDISGSGNWPVNEWIRLKAYATTASNEDGLYISNYIGSAVGDKIWSFGPQIETGSKMSPLVRQTRSTTDAWKDRSGNDYHGDFSGGVNTGASHLRRGQVIEPISNAYLDFDGTDDYVNCGDIKAGLSAPDFVTNGTVCVWVNPDDLTNNRFIWSKNATGGGTTYVTARLASSGKVAYALYGGWGWSSTIYTSSVLVVGTWTHLAFTWETNKISLYRDGVLQNTTSPSGTWGGGGTNSFWLGSSESNQPGDWNGQMGALQVYKTNLTAAQVKANFNAQRGRFGV